MVSSTPHIDRAVTLESRNAFLDGVKQRLERHGWCQHSYGTDIGPYCLTGAMYEESQLRKTDSLTYREAKSALNGACDDSIIRWNDQPGRRLSEVIELLERAKLQPIIEETSVERELY